jgi:hypothetical protein
MNTTDSLLETLFFFASGSQRKNYGLKSLVLYKQKMVITQEDDTKLRTFCVQLFKERCG